MRVIKSVASGAVNMAKKAAHDPYWRRLQGSEATAFDEGVESWTDAVEAAGLNWRVEMGHTQAYLLDENGVEVVDSPAERSTIRVNPDGTKKVLKSGLSKGYRPVQPADAFAFVDNVAAGSGRWVAAGSTGDGERIFGVMQLDQTLLLDEGNRKDSVLTFLGFDNRNDGGGSYRSTLGFLREICANGMTALGEGSVTIAIQHRSGLDGKIAEARRLLNLSFKASEAFAAQAELLLATPMDKSEFRDFAHDIVLPVDEDASERTKNGVARRRELLRNLWDAPTQDNVRDTRWGAYCAVTEFFDHSQPWIKDADSRHAHAQLDGRFDTAKRSALKALLPA